MNRLQHCFSITVLKDTEETMFQNNNDVPTQVFSNFTYKKKGSQSTFLSWIRIMCTKSIVFTRSQLVFLKQTLLFTLCINNVRLSPFHYKAPCQKNTYGLRDKPIQMENMPNNISGFAYWLRIYFFSMQKPSEFFETLDR